MSETIDDTFMRMALSLARPGLGNTWPNPSVGALIVKDGAIIGRGVTAEGGRPHAETFALMEAGSFARNGTMYVTLEPCAHQGETPPCTEAIITAGIKRVVIACIDPNPKVAGKGIMQLRAAGIEVIDAVCSREASALNEGFFSVILRSRPFITLKLATSKDEKISGQQGQWITCEASRERVHHLRSSQDAILTGIGTVLVDNPKLTARIPHGQNPQRVLLDGKLRVPEDAHILPARIFTSAKALKAYAPKAELLTKHGSMLFAVAYSNGQLSLPDVLRQLTQDGITRLMVEAGSALAASFIRERLVDRIYWFCSPDVIGDVGKEAVAGYAQSIAALPGFTAQTTEAVGSDMLTILNCAS